MIGNLILLTALLLGADGELPKGHLVIAGGGTTTPEIMQRTLDLAGGLKAQIVLIPQASPYPTAGQRMLERWRANGAEHVTVLDLTDPKAAVAAIEGADLIWIGGGNQARLMEALAGTGVAEAIQARFQRGATVYGTSAGAAVMSSLMIAGYTGPRGTPGGGKALIAKGLGLWPDVIVDQHFLRRRRFDRLKGAVREHPDKIGVGIDESTAVVVSGREFEVLGASEVIVIDPRKPTRPKAGGEADPPKPMGEG
ncbi:MAG: cyanophycinase, partial [Isosphaeraceae bacterium]|nr:cyanophycinase [Isosphaeraceae bacterium]